jgi:hypothetical protein
MVEFFKRSRSSGFDVRVVRVGLVSMIDTHEESTKNRIHSRCVERTGTLVRQAAVGSPIFEQL